MLNSSRHLLKKPTGDRHFLPKHESPPALSLARFKYAGITAAQVCRGLEDQEGAISDCCASYARGRPAEHTSEVSLVFFWVAAFSPAEFSPAAFNGLSFGDFVWAQALLT